MSRTLSNDLIELKPNVEYREPVLKFDFPGLKIGTASYEEGPTGCTVFHFSKRSVFTTDFRGGSGPFLINYHLNIIDAICLAGGSLYGFEAITGVTAELLKQQDYSSDWFQIPLVAGAICYDLGWRNNVIYPDKDLGRAALASAREGVFPMGNQGAGRAATVGKLDPKLMEAGGQGAAFTEIDDTKILFFTVTNSLGALVDKSGRVVRGNYDKSKKKRYKSYELIKNRRISLANEGNTTLSLLVTNQKFSVYELHQIAKQIHSYLSRAIDPFHTVDDGDVLFAVTTNEVKNKKLSTSEFGIIASDIAWDAVLNSFEPKFKLF